MGDGSWMPHGGPNRMRQVAGHRARVTRETKTWCTVESDGQVCTNSVSPEAGMSICLQHMLAAVKEIQIVLAAIGEKRPDVIPQIRALLSGVGGLESVALPLPCPGCNMLALQRWPDLHVECDECGTAMSGERYEEWVRELVAALPSPVAEEPREEVVYYLRFADRIKIGTTTNFPRRLMSIPHDEVLATEPGGYALEARRHREFETLRITGEWFQEAPELLRHIAALRDHHG